MADDANINRTLYMDRVSTVCMAAFSHPQSEASFSPKGRVLSQYTVDDQPFTLHLDSLTTPEAVSTFKKMQAFGYWFIDGASEIVVAPDSPHRWLVLTLFTSVQGHPVLAGYCLLYLFSNPFQSPPHSLRLCQILVLPPFQKQGHSSRIFDCVYRTLMHTPPLNREKQNWRSIYARCCNQIRCRERNGAKILISSKLRWKEITHRSQKIPRSITTAPCRWATAGPTPT